MKKKMFSGTIEDELKRAIRSAEHALRAWKESDVFDADRRAREAMEALRAAVAQMTQYIDGTAT